MRLIMPWRHPYALRHPLAYRRARSYGYSPEEIAVIKAEAAACLLRQEETA